ncbi:hypothetical protein IB265_18180 [Ensifer sp. ENS10]|uniref:hypothetical protein n=1 Tax=unclassified Ensifer TaxID=2633371 RepID=UPI000DE0090C|nr:hypothetical protein [Ensifer sp. ENS10]MBD9508719.1 hypothetical protein [Ensifer sp. ENS10]
MLAVVLIEIRATENLQMAQILADVFHNVPAGISSGFYAEAIEAEVIARAARLDCQRQIAAMFDAATRKSVKQGD